MLVQGEHDLNLVHMYTGSFKEVLKQTMLSQEVMFRKQVLELHRLYGVQRMLMQKFGFKEFDGCSFKKAGIKPTFLPCTKTARYDPLVKETKTSSISMLEERPGKNYKLQHMPLDLHLPADQYISLVGEDLEELNLSLNIGMGCREKESAKETLLYKKSRILSGEVFDLEDSIDRDAENVPSLNFNSPTIKCTGKEFENSHSHISSDNLSIKKEHFGPYKAGYLDLNAAQHDDSSCHSNDPIMTCHSTLSSSPCFKGEVGKVSQAKCSSPIWVKDKTNCSIESSTLEQDTNLDLMDSGSGNERIEIHTTKSKFKETNASEMDTPRDEALIGPTANFSEDLSNSSDGESKKFEAVLDLPVIKTNDKNCVAPANRHSRLQKSGVCYDCSQIAQDGSDSILMVSGMSACIAENDSGGVKNVQNLSLPAYNQCYKTQKGLHVTETTFSTEQEHRSSDSIESEHDEESSQMKLLIRNAAESLVCMSLTDSACTHDCDTKIDSNDMEKDQVEPQHSSDSFEILVLQQTENDEDEYTVSSRLSEITDLENKDFGFKLRRGRRLKDFQKEILPGLSSLSRHEICEDINILEAVLRSREYRKIKAKMSGGQTWCAPMRSKRSRLNHVRRRIIL